MKKQEIYYTIDEFGRIKKDKFTTYINNHAWCMPAIVIFLTLLGAWVEGTL